MFCHPYLTPYASFILHENGKQLYSFLFYIHMFIFVWRIVGKGVRYNTKEFCKQNAQHSHHKNNTDASAQSARFIPTMLWCLTKLFVRICFCVVWQNPNIKSGGWVSCWFSDKTHKQKFWILPQIKIEKQHII